jgi:hypothetical protein
MCFAIYLYIKILYIKTFVNFLHIDRKVQTDTMTLVAVLLAASLAAGATAPVRLARFPQKVRTFHSLEDPRVPARLKQAPGTATGEITVAATASDGARWEGTQHGLFRLDARAAPADQRQYMAGRRYLPDDEVLQLVPDSAAGMWVRTRTGISHIELRPMRLAEKAELFERRIRERHDRYGLVANSTLVEPGNLATNRLTPNDNDGLWTAIYAAAQCFRYAVTRAPDALAQARKSTEAVLFLEQVTGRPGFPARSFVKRGDWRPEGGTWHWTSDGAYEWKADTSSDEIVGHFFLFGIAWDLLPDPALKRRIATTAARVMDHILQHGLYLTDVTGQPTYWGRWSPDYFATARGRPDSPLNALELLSFLKTAWHVTGEPKYDSEYRRIAQEMGYAKLTTRLLEVRRQINYSDEELAMLPLYLLFQYETDPRLLGIYREAMGQWWQNMRREKNPLWTLIYLRGQPHAEVDLDGAVWTLYRIPLDLIEWTVRNSHRRDIEMTPQEDRFGRAQSETLLPPDERHVMKWNNNPFQLDGGNGGRSEDDGAFFLLPYWLGRFHGYMFGD